MMISFSYKINHAYENEGERLIVTDIFYLLITYFISSHQNKNKKAF